ncbi:CsbD family protein [Streptomyces sp. MS1.HAVA.3]|uniref:CsbD family protein n=1 Tax=Streptomyces caledonius TaxID=3134107 RepID=A0ABU8U9B1_9ACTN
MGIGRKVRNTMHALQARITDGLGRTTHHGRLTGRGRTDRPAGNPKQSVEKIKSAFRR